MTFEIQLLN